MEGVDGAMFGLLNVVSEGSAMDSADSGSSGTGSSPGQIHCVVFFVARHFTLHLSQCINGYQ